MEPRPPSHRSAPDASASRHPHPGDTGAYQTPDPTTVVAPPRADYDYSPLDLAPSGQRRRRQLVAGALGALVAIMLAGAVVFAFLLLQDDDGDGESNSIAAAQTEVAQSRATVSAQETVVANAANGTEAPGEAAGEDTTDPADPAGGSPEAAADDATEPPADAGIDEAGDTTGQAPEATGDDPDESQALVDALGGGGVGGSPSAEELNALLPDSGIVPQGLGTTTDVSRTQAEVVSALGGSREAETNLATWGWSANVERSFIAVDPSVLAPDAVSSIIVSMHGFADEQAAAAALTFYSDIVVAGGYQEQAQSGSVGSTSRLLTLQDESGGTTVALYVQDGPVLYRIGGFSQGGDPSQAVIDLANAMLAP